MNVTVVLPDEVGERLRSRWPDVSGHAMDVLITDAYRGGVLSVAEVQRLRGLTSRWEAEAFLKRCGAWHEYSEEDLLQDIRAIRETAVS